VDELLLLPCAGLAYWRVCSGLECGDILAGSPVLPVSQAGKLLFGIVHGQGDAELLIVESDGAEGVLGGRYVDESAAFAAGPVAVDWLGALFEIAFAVEDGVVHIEAA